MDAVYEIHVQLGCMVLFLICLRIAILEMKFLNFHRLNEQLDMKHEKELEKRTQAKRTSFSIIETCPLNVHNIFIFSLNICAHKSNQEQ